jgi:hypothetical protein
MEQPKPIRSLDPERLIATSGLLETWLKSVFPTTHLTKVATEVTVFTKQAVATAERLRQPIWPLRVGVWLVILLAVAGAVHQFIVHPFGEILGFLNRTGGAALYLGTALAVFIGLEVRLKRRRAVKAINELRALAHVVDMHQLAKDVAIEEFRDGGRTEKFEEYLHACTALLALLSKIGQLYAEHLPDPVTTSAVNDFEMITTGLSNKIWMKILSMKKFDAAPAEKQG